MRVCLWHSFDARRSGGDSGGNGRHWWDEERFGRRLRFVLPQPSSTAGSTPAGTAATSQSARLQIWNVTSLDAGDYRCRVDFNTAPSRNFKYRLYVAGKCLFCSSIHSGCRHIASFPYQRERDSAASIVSHLLLSGVFKET